MLQSSAIWPEMVRDAVHYAFLNTLTMTRDRFRSKPNWNVSIQAILLRLSFVCICVTMITVTPITLDKIKQRLYGAYNVLGYRGA